MSGLRQSTVDAVVRGITQNPGLKTLYRIATGFGMTLSEFLDFPEMNEVEFDDFNWHNWIIAQISQAGSLRLGILLLPLGLTKPLVQPGVSKKGLANKTSVLQSRWFGNRITKEQGGFTQGEKWSKAHNAFQLPVRIPRGIRTKVPEKSDLQNIKGRCDSDHKKAVQRDESGNHRGRSVPRPHSSPGEYPTVHEYSTVCGDAQEQKRTDDLR